MFSPFFVPYINHNDQGHNHNREALKSVERVMPAEVEPCLTFLRNTLFQVSCIIVKCSCRRRQNYHFNIFVITIINVIIIISIMSLLDYHNGYHDLSANQHDPRQMIIMQIKRSRGFATKSESDKESS